MADESTQVTVKNYLKELTRLGIPVSFGVMYGSRARNDFHRWSDIDLLVVSPAYDTPYSREDINLLWRTAARTDSRIEPLPVGLNRWKTDDESTIIESARREGIQVNADDCSESH